MEMRFQRSEKGCTGNDWVKIYAKNRFNFICRAKTKSSNFFLFLTKDAVRIALTAGSKESKE